MSELEFWENLCNELDDCVIDCEKAMISARPFVDDECTILGAAQNIRSEINDAREKLCLVLDIAQDKRKIARLKEALKRKESVENE